jgi:ABC-type phosphate transport system auxiliary subunit
MENEIKAVEVVSEDEKIKASMLAQKADFQKQLENVKTEMSNLQKQFEDKKLLGVRLEGALQSLELLLKPLQK